MRTFAVLGVCILFCGCMTAGFEPPSLLTTQEEVALGAKLAVQVEKEEKVLRDSQVQAYVSEIGQRLARVATRQDLTYQFKVIDDPDTVNAFALPGGYLYVYTGLMKLCANEAELASVMAHEIGHVAAHHHGEMMTRQLGYNFLISLILGRDPNQNAQLVADLVGSLRTMHFSRVDEREADQLGMEFLFRGGYKPEAMLTFMHRMFEEDERAGGGFLLPIFSSHPPTEERIARLQALIQQYPPEARAQNTLNDQRYQQVVLHRLQ